jgi:hypothetical protein
MVNAELSMDNGYSKNIVGVYTHVFHIANLYTPGYYGWYRIHNSVFKTLHKLQVDEDGEPRTAEEVARRSHDSGN